MDAALQYGKDLLQRAELQSQVTGCWGVASSNIIAVRGHRVSTQTFVVSFLCFPIPDQGCSWKIPIRRFATR